MLSGLLLPLVDRMAARLCNQAEGLGLAQVLGAAAAARKSLLVKYYTKGAGAEHQDRRMNVVSLRKNEHTQAHTTSHTQSSEGAVSRQCARACRLSSSSVQPGDLAGVHIVHAALDWRSGDDPAEGVTLFVSNWKVHPSVVWRVAPTQARRHPQKLPLTGETRAAA